MSEKFEYIKGLALLSDPSAVAPGYLPGGQNFVKRNSVGMKRRPGFGAFDVESAAAISIGATSPRAVFPFSYYGADPHVVGFANGVLNKYDGADSFDQVTKGLTDAIPTQCSLGEYGVIASGGRVLKYDGIKVPSPIGSQLIADMEATETWATAGTGTPTDDTTNELSGTQCKKGVLTAGQTITWTLTPADELMRSVDKYSFTSKTVGKSSTVTRDSGATVTNTSGETVTVASVMFDIRNVGGTPSGNTTIRVKRVNALTGIPYGNDLTTATFSDYTVGVKFATFGATFTVEDGEKVAIVWDIVAQSAGNYYNLYGGTQNKTGVPLYRYDDDTELGAFLNDGTNIPVHLKLFSASMDLESGYQNDSVIKFHMFMDVVANFAIGVDSFFNFIDGDGDSAKYQFTSAELATAWNEISLIRGISADEAGKGNSDFVITGTIDWSNITSVEIKITSVTDTLTIYLDYMFLLDLYAPPVTGNVSRADNRVWPIVGNRFYYSDMYTPNNFSLDAYIDFADNGIGAVQGGQRVVCLTESEANICTPLQLIPTSELAAVESDYDVRKLSMYGCIDPKACGEMTYKGQRGAYWITKNHGIMFYPGDGEPITISAGVQKIFIDSRANTTDFDYTRSSEVITLFHPRWNELWIFYPSLITAETNLTYALVLDCDSGEWMTPFVWANTAKLIYASVYRDSNDGLYKILLLDTDGKVWKEGFVGDTILTSATSRDGYVDGTTKGKVIVPYIDTWYFHGEGKQVVFHEVHVKFKPNTTEAMELNIDKRVATIGSGVDKDTLPFEENVVYSEAFSDMAQRTVTLATITDVIERNVFVGEGVEGQAIGFRVGMQDIVDGDTDTPELEVIGVSVKGGEQGGRG